MPAFQNIEHKIHSQQPFYLSLSFWVWVIVLLLIFKYINKKKRQPSESIQERTWKKLIFSHNELFSSMSEEDKRLLRETYLNTVKNSQTMNVKNDDEAKNMILKKKIKKVNFKLEDNVTYAIPYYSKDLFYND